MYQKVYYGKLNGKYSYSQNLSEFLQRDSEIKGISFECMYQSLYYKEVKWKVLVFRIFIRVFSTK